MQKTLRNELVQNECKTEIKSAQKYVQNKNEHIQN